MSNVLKAVKMADIARELGVSTVAVSKALAGQKGVSEDLRARVRATAARMGYQPPRKAARGEGVNLGVLIPERYLGDNVTFYWRMYQEVTARASQKECFTLLELLSDEDAAAGRFPKLVTENKADALIIIGRPPHGYASALRAGWHRPVVFLDFYDADLRADAIVSGGFYGTYQLTNYLFEKGHRNIGFVGTLLATESITDRYLGYVKSLMEHGVQVRADWIVNDRDTVTGLNVDMALPREMPTAFVCNCDFMASEFIRRLRERGFQVPRDVSVVGFDNYLYNGLCDIGITTYSVDIREMAQCAVRTALRRAQGEPAHLGLQMTTGALVEKDSVRDISEKMECADS